MTESPDWGAVTAWVVDHVDTVTAPLKFELIAGGRSNLTYRVEDSRGRVMVLRRPPRGGVLATAHDMSREWRAVSALGPSAVPVPPAVAFCADEAVDGAQFYLMEFVPGAVVAETEDAQTLSTDARGVAGRDLMRVMAALHTVDPDEVGLGDLGRRGGYVERQLHRWKGQWDRSKTRELAAVEEGFERLAERVPQQNSTAIVHGDFRLGNMILRPDGSINAVLDWELCTLGDPLADLGWLLSDWSGQTGGDAMRATRPTALPGFPTREEMLDAYATATSRDVSHIDYYIAFARWRLACIGEGVYARYRSGVMGDVDVDLASLRAQVEQRADATLDALDHLDRVRP